MHRHDDGLTVKGKLSRANWEDLKYHGYPGQTVRLQFREAGGAHYGTVKTVKTDNLGRLSTKVTSRRRAAGAGTSPAPRRPR